VLAAFVYFLNECVCVLMRTVRGCVFVCVTPGSDLLSSLHNGGVSGECYHGAWLFGGLGGGGASKGPRDAEKVTELKRGQGYSACLHALCVCVCVCKSQEGSTQEGPAEELSSQHATGLPSLPP